ncbi:hypothetical protein [Kitasatospora sp. NPDC092286]|uniref:hypothetical protein n=1 Tax=Kitasatospora sp. NPDC092286 TaxID=3364087 RepID=UPI00381CC5CD
MQAKTVGVSQGRNFHALADAGAVLYIAECDELDALKVGVTSRASRTSRIQRHAQHGWHTMAEISFKDGRQAFVAEQAVLAFLRACGARETLRQDQLPQGGYTETISFAQKAHLSADRLLTIARIAAETVIATERPTYVIAVVGRRTITTLAEAVDELEALDRAGRKREAAELAAEIRVGCDVLLESLEAFRTRLLR